MFTVDINEELNTFQVKAHDQANSIVSEGAFALDKADYTVLIILHYVTLVPTDYEQFNQFLATVISDFGQLFKSVVVLRLPEVFDNKLDLEKVDLKRSNPWFMCAASQTLKFDLGDKIKDTDQYELITDRQRILSYAEDVLTLMTRDGFWCSKWDLDEMKARMNSATTLALIMDKASNQPCGFGRLFLLNDKNKPLGYLSDIVVDPRHQSRGLGGIIVNCLIETSMKQLNQQEQQHVVLTLQCANKGTGVISAPKLYKRSGFEFFGDIGNRVAICGSSEYYVSRA